MACQDDAEFTRKAEEWCRGRADRYKARRIFLPSGETPKPLYRLWEAERPSYLQNTVLTQLDEIVSGPKTGAFARFFRDELPSYTQQFVRIEEQMEPPDLLLLGLGMNGHVAFHEPHVREDLYRGFVNLTDETCERLGVAERTRAMTFGVRCFQQSKAILLMVRGEGKKRILAEILQPNCRLPAALLKSHADLTILADQKALS